MKIYPSLHKAIETEKLLPKDIPLSCIVSDASETDFKIQRSSNTSRESKVASVMPYETFSRADAYLFDKSGNLLNVADKMNRDGDKYYFVPSNATEFHPELFDFRVLIKKTAHYKSNKDYRMNVQVIDKEGDLSKSLIKIFGDAHRRNIAPVNISINEKDIRIESLASKSIEESDFIIIESKDGVHYWDDDSLINIDEMLNAHCNVWLSVDSFEDLISESSDNAYEIQSPVLFVNEDTVTNNYPHRFSTDRLHQSFFDYKVMPIFIGAQPALVMHKEKKGYVIVTEKSLLMNALDNHKLIYNILMEIYLSSYYSSKWISSWITDEKVDYIAIKETTLGQTHPKAKMQDIMKNEYFSIEDGYYFVGVDCSDGVTFQGLSSDMSLNFKKKGDLKKDPVRSKSMRSLYTTRQTVMHYEDYSVNKMETELSLEVEQTPTGNYLIVDIFKSTSLMIDIKDKQRLRIPDMYGTYDLICQNNILTLAIKGTYEESLQIVKMAEVSVISKRVTKNYDIRTLGGGLPEGEVDNFNLLDIGHIEGRPYRVGGSMVVRLPKQYKEHHDMIHAALTRHISSGDYFVIAYE